MWPRGPDLAMGRVWLRATGGATSRLDGLAAKGPRPEAVLGTLELDRAMGIATEALA